jgi:menaquinone-9 beta-reductase
MHGLPLMAEGADVVVVGGGPAGSATAAGLARAGFHVVLVDRSAFPRRKPCGECLNPGAVAAVRRLGLLDELLGEAHGIIRGWRIHPVTGSGFQGGFSDGEWGLAMRRNRFDAILLEHARRAGVELRLGERVGDLLRADGAVSGVVTDRGRISARVVVGADGLRSVVVRRADLLRRRPRLRKLALTAHVRGVQPAAETGSMHLTADGCVGIAHVGAGQANVVVVTALETGARIGGERDAFFDRSVAAIPELATAERLEPAMATGPFDWPIRTAVADRVLLVGDAAGYYDPFTGQGIYRALRGAELALPVLTDSLRRERLSARDLQAYETARRREFGAGERLQRVIEAVVSRPGVLGVAARFFASRPRVADALFMVTGDARPTRSLFSLELLRRS